MKKVIVFEEKEFETLRRAIIKAIIEESKKGYGVKFISRDINAGGEELEDMAMWGHLLMCIDKVWPT